MSAGVGPGERLRRALSFELLEQLDVAVVACDADLVVREWNPAAERLFGWPRALVVGRSPTDLGISPEEQTVARARAEEITVSGQWSGDIPVATPDGGLVSYRFRATPLRADDGELLGFVALAVDSAEHAAAEQARAVFDAMFGDSPVGLGILSEDLRYIRLNAAMEQMSGVRSEDVVGLRVLDVFPDYTVVHEMLQKVAATGEPVLSVEVSGETPSTGGQVHAWLLSAYKMTPLSGDPRVVFVSVDITARRTAERAAFEANRRLRLLAEVGELFARDLDLDTRLEALGDLLVPDLADHLLIDVVADDGAVRRAVLRHAPDVPEPERFAAYRPGEQVVFGPTHPVGVALESRRSVHMRDIPDEVVEQALRNDAAVAHARAIGIGSAVCVPMVVHGEAFGVLTLLTSRSGRKYDRADADLIEEIAARAAGALENSRRFAREREVALHLQRSLLPTDLPVLPGLEMVWAYEPGAAELTVGGDFVDAFALPGGRIGLTVGDVMGRGLVAAGVMGQIRTSLRAYAALDWRPSDVLAAADVLVAGDARADVQIATCLYAVLDPTTDQLEVANAGHVPPLVIDERGAHPLELPTGPPLGLGGASYEETTTMLPPGTLLALCSDGLVESRDLDLADGLGALGRLLGEADGDLRAVCHAAMELRPGGRDGIDDAVLLLARVTAAMPRMVEALPFTLHGPEAARRRLTEFLSESGAEDLVERAALCVSELVTNALEHARPPVGLRARLAGDELHVEVRDCTARLPQPRDAAPDDEGGRGLAILDAMVERWGTHRRGQEKAVWFTLRRSTETD